MEKNRFIPRNKQSFSEENFENSRELSENFRHRNIYLLFLLFYLISIFVNVNAWILIVLHAISKRYNPFWNHFEDSAFVTFKSAKMLYRRELILRQNIASDKTNLFFQRKLKYIPYNTFCLAFLCNLSPLLSLLCLRLK